MAVSTAVSPRGRILRAGDVLSAFPAVAVRPLWTSCFVNPTRKCRNSPLTPHPSPSPRGGGEGARQLGCPRGPAPEPSGWSTASPPTGTGLPPLRSSAHTLCPWSQGPLGGSLQHLMSPADFSVPPGEGKGGERLRGGRASAWMPWGAGGKGAGVRGAGGITASCLWGRGGGRLQGGTERSSWRGATEEQVGAGRVGPGLAPVPERQWTERQGRWHEDRAARNTPHTGCRLKGRLWVPWKGREDGHSMS